MCNITKWLNVIADYRYDDNWLVDVEQKKYGIEMLCNTFQMVI